MKSLLTVKDVAERYKVHQETIRRWVLSNKIPYLSLNGNTRFDEERLTTWEQSRKVEPKRLIA